MRHPIADQWIEGWGPLSTYTGLQERTLQRHAREGAFNVVRLTDNPRGRVRFLRDEIDQWLLSVVPVSSPADSC